MSKDKDDAFVAYKFKSLKVYGSTEWLADGKKKYQTVFEASITKYIYCEFAFFNKLFDEKDWKVKVNLRCFHLGPRGGKGKKVCNIDVEREVKSTENVVFIREGWGNVTAGKFWKKGSYLWEAYLDGNMVGTKKLHIENGGVVGESGNPYFNVRGLKLFEGSSALPVQKDRRYMTAFSGKESRFIWGELEIQNLRNEDWYCEAVFNFYNDARQLKGQTSEVVKIKKAQNMLKICSGWGSAKKGTWYQDNYTLEIVFMESLVAVVPFSVGITNLEGETIPMLPTLGGGLEAPEALQDKSLDELMKDLDSLIGLESIKKKIREYTQYLNFIKIRQEKGFDEPGKLSLHAVFTGNPGTGKTTVANRLGKIYHKMGLLSKGHVHEVDRAELVGEYIGQTAPKVKEAIKAARGGILFIDEAYSLARAGNDNKDYGKEVIEILLKEMSDGPGDLAILVAGYPQEMGAFLNSNPGLKSRFNMYYEFPDYIPQELASIADFAMKKRMVHMTEDAQSYLYEKLVEAYRNRDRSFGNARYVNSLVDESKMNMGLRIMKTADPATLSEEELSQIELEDLEKIFGAVSRLTADIPIDEDLLHRATHELKSLIGLDQVKTEIEELVKLVKFYREIGKDVMNSFSLHSVFTGNPGTGKTTVARILANIFKALGILEKGHIVECDRQSLVGGYLGQTAIKTAKAIDSAKGGVLFIDEAYALTQGGGGDYGKEAVETILKRMEDERGQFIVIAAGYPDNMKHFLESNPGLKSRFDKVFNFEDYTADQLYSISLKMLEPENIEPDEQAATHLKAYFDYIHSNKDKYFGNARAVRKVVEEAVKNQHLRLAQIDSSLRDDAALRTLTFEDVDEFHSDRVEMLENKSNRIGFRSGASPDQGATE